MKRFRFYAQILVILFLPLLIGCSAKVESQETTETAIQETTAPTVASIPETTACVTTIPTEVTKPDHSLQVETGMQQLRFVDANTQEYMDYCLNIPDHPERNMPLVVFLHGALEIGHVELLQDYGIVNTTKEIYGNDYPFFLLLPCTHVYGWTSASVTGTLIALIDSVCDEYDIDRQKIIITGHSLGSTGTWKMIGLYGDYFSAAVPVSCGIDEEIDFNQCAKVPVKAFCGTNGMDEHNFGLGMERIVGRINDVGGNAVYTVIEGADHEAMVTAAYTKELFDWMLSQ